MCPRPGFRGPCAAHPHAEDQIDQGIGLAHVLARFGEGGGDFAGIERDLEPLEEQALPCALRADQHGEVTELEIRVDDLGKGSRRRDGAWCGLGCWKGDAPRDRGWPTDSSVGTAISRSRRLGGREPARRVELDEGARGHQILLDLCIEGPRRRRPPRGDVRAGDHRSISRSWFRTTRQRPSGACRPRARLGTSNTGRRRQATSDSKRASASECSPSRSSR